MGIEAPGGGFNVDATALDAVGSQMAKTAEDLGTVRVDTALNAAPVGLPGTATASAMKSVALAMSAAVAAYAVETNGIATRTGDASKNYRVIDDSVANAMTRLAVRA